MTDMVRSSADDHWQKAVGQALAVAATVFFGRWAAGATFGFVIFLLVWLPTVGAWSRERICPPQRICSGGAAILATLVALMASWPANVATALTALLCLYGATVFAVAGLCRMLIGPQAASAIATSLWLTWLTAPLLMTRILLSRFPESVAAGILSVNPLVVFNWIDSTAGDWTHQAVAYRVLTRLGQDTLIDWPASVWPSVGVHLAIAGIFTALSRIVPRGTLKRD